MVLAKKASSYFHPAIVTHFPSASLHVLQVIDSVGGKKNWQRLMCSQCRQSLSALEAWACQADNLQLAKVCRDQISIKHLPQIVMESLNLTLEVQYNFHFSNSHLGIVIIFFSRLPGSMLTLDIKYNVTHLKHSNLLHYDSITLLCTSLMWQ